MGLMQAMNYQYCFSTARLNQLSYPAQRPLLVTTPTSTDCPGHHVCSLLDTFSPQPCLQLPFPLSLLSTPCANDWALNTLTLSQSLPDCPVYRPAGWLSCQVSCLCCSVSLSVSVSCLMALSAGQLSCQLPL